MSIEQFEEVKKQNEEIRKALESVKKAQSGSDSTVTKLQQLLEQKEEENKTEEQKFSERLAAVERERDEEKKEKQAAVLKGVAIQLLSENKVSAPKYLDRLIGKDAEETEALIMAYIEERLAIQLSVADEFAKTNGRTVQKNKGKGDFKTIEEYSDAEIEAMSNSEFVKIQNRSKK
jgi:hypothetical protein